MVVISFRKIIFGFTALCAENMLCLDKPSMIHHFSQFLHDIELIFKTWIFHIFQLKTGFNKEVIHYSTFKIYIFSSSENLPLKFNHFNILLLSF